MLKSTRSYERDLQPVNDCSVHAGLNPPALTSGIGFPEYPA